MKLIIDLPAGKALVTGIAFLSPSFKAVQGFCKLDVHPSLSYSLIPKKQVAVNDPVIDNGPLKQFNRLVMTDKLLKRHGFLKKDSRIRGFKGSSEEKCPVSRS